MIFPVALLALTPIAPILPSPRFILTPILAELLLLSVLLVFLFVLAWISRLPFASRVIFSPVISLPLTLISPAVAFIFTFSPADIVLACASVV